MLFIMLYEVVPTFWSVFKRRWQQQQQQQQQQSLFYPRAYNKYLQFWIRKIIGVLATRNSLEVKNARQPDEVLLFLFAHSCSEF